MEEIWKDIQGYEGKYQVSNLGRVRSLDHTFERKRHGKTYIIPVKGRILKPYLDRGYYVVGLWNNSKQRRWAVHRLVAFAFVPGYKDGYVVHHKNRITTDNRPINLQWCTNEYNLSLSVYNLKPVYQYDIEGNYIAKHRCFEDVYKLICTYNWELAYVLYQSKTKILKGYRWSLKPLKKEDWIDIINKNRTFKRQIIQYDDNGIEITRYDSLSDAAKSIGVSIAAICYGCQGKSKRVKGYKLSYQ